MTSYPPNCPASHRSFLCLLLVCLAPGSLFGADPAAKDPAWPFTPPVRPATPPVQHAAWVKNPIDAFVLARLESAGLQPNPQADRLTLLRRVTYDLTGMLPT